MNDRLSIEDAAEDRRLSGLLAALPREKASEDFTARVLQRIAAAPAKTTSSKGSRSKTVAPRWPVSAPLLAAAALLLITLAFGGRELWHRHQHQETVARFEALRAEHAALEAELHGLRRLAVEARPVLYLGGDETVDYVVDLSRSRRREGSYPHLGNTNPDSPHLSTTTTETSTEMDDLSPSQLRQHPRRIY